MSQILIADDDPLLSELVRFKLEELGHDVLIVNDGAAAFAAARDHAPDAIVLDSMMPILSGPETLRALKQTDETTSIPVVMLTMRKGQQDIIDALRAGAADYLTKPFIPDELAIRIARLLEANTMHHGRSEEV